MTSLHLIRHAETDLAGRFCGHSDPPLNAAGLRQTQKLVGSLRSAQLQAVFTSDLQRALATAHAIAESLCIPCFRRPALREIDFGRWEGLCWSEIEAADPSYACEWLRCFPNLPAPGGDTFASFEARVVAEAVYLFNETPFQQIAVVSHAGVMRTLLRHFSGANEQQAWQLTQAYCDPLRIPKNDCEVKRS